MVFYGGTKPHMISDLLMIDLDTLDHEVEKTDFTPSFWHGTTIWNDRLIVFPGFYLKHILIRHMKHKTWKRIPVPQEYGFFHNPLSFTLNDELYISLKNDYLCRFDLNKGTFSKIEKKFPFPLRTFSMFLYKDELYYFGSFQKITCRLFKVNLDTFENKEVNMSMEIQSRCCFSDHLHQDELIIFGGYNKLRLFDELVRISLLDPFQVKLKRILESKNGEISFYFI